MGIAASPSRLVMDVQGHGWLHLINPNEFRVRYLLNSTADLSRATGVIEADSSVRIGVKSDDMKEVVASFESKSFIPSIKIPVLPYEVPVRKGFLVGGLTVLIGLLLIAFFRLVYAS